MNARAGILFVDGSRGRIAPGYRAEFVLLDNDLRCVATRIGGALANG